MPTRWRRKVKAGLDNDERLGIIEKVPTDAPITWMHKMVVVPGPNGELRRTVDMSALAMFQRGTAQDVMHPLRQAKLVPAQTWKTVTDAGGCSYSTLIREEDRHYTTFATQWGAYRYKVAPQEYDEYSRLHDEITGSVERKEKVMDETLLWDTHQDLETHWWRTFDYLTTMGEHGMFLNGDKFQFCEKIADFAGLRVSEQELRPLPSYRESVTSTPTPQNADDVRSWCNFVDQVAQCTQLQDTVAPLKPLLSPRATFSWNKELGTAFSNSKRAVLDALGRGINLLDPTEPSGTHAEDVGDSGSRTSVTLHNKVLKLITLGLVKSLSENDPAIQGALAHLAQGTPKENTGVGEVVRELWSCSDKLSAMEGVLMYDGALVIPHGLRQAVLDTIESAYQEDQAIGDRVANAVFWPCISEDVADHRKSLKKAAPSRPHRGEMEADAV